MPAPAGVIETRARARRRRNRFTAATSAVAVVAVAAGVALGAGGGRGGGRQAPAPGTPVSTSVTGSATAPHVTSTNRAGAAALMQPAELPLPGVYQWKQSSTDNHSAGSFAFPVCGANAADIHPTKTRAQTEELAEYTSATDSSISQESIYHYASAAAARQDYDLLKPDAGTCQGVHVIAKAANGYAWEDSVQGTSSMQKMMVLSGNDIAFWYYQYGGQNGAYDTSDADAALQRMAARLDGRTPTPDPHTDLPSTVLPGSAWLDAKQIPFATADRSHGWFLMNGQQSSPGVAPATDLCAAATGGIVGGTDTTDLTRMYHGTPSTTPVYAGSNYLYSSANQDVFPFPSVARAQAAFAYAKQVTGQHSCQFKDSSGEQTSRTVEVGTVGGSGFSLLLKDEPGPSYEHVYVVVKGTYVSTLMVNFEQGDTSTGGDAAILAAMAGRLP